MREKVVREKVVGVEQERGAAVRHAVVPLVVMLSCRMSRASVRG